MTSTPVTLILGWSISILCRPRSDCADPNQIAPSNQGLHQIILLHLIRVYAIFYSTFSINLAILLAISDTTADQTIPLIRICTISYSAVVNKHKRKYGDDTILNIGPKYSSIHSPDHTTPSNPGLCNFLLCFFFFQLI